MAAAPPSAPPSPPSTTPADKDVLLAMFTEVSEQLRFRSQAEHLYTAAAVGAFGAVSWGVATLQLDKYSDRCLTHPAVIAASGVLFVAVCVNLKIVDEHLKWHATRKEQARIAILLSSLPGAAGIIPVRIIEPGKGLGFAWSMILVGVAAAVAICFCLTVRVRPC